MSDTSPFELVFPRLKPALEARGFTSLTPVQQAVLDPELAGQNLRMSSQTGSGKTVAIGLLLAQSLCERLEDKELPRPTGPLVLVIAPTRELAAQVREELNWLYADMPGFRSTVVTGGTDIGRERRALRLVPTLLVGTPGRLLDHINAGALDLTSVMHVVLDEADQMLDMGFRDELDGIVQALPEGRRSHLVSATFPSQVRRFADRFQGSKAKVLAATELGAANADIEHVGHLVHTSQRYDALVNCLLMAQGERCLVFVRRRCDAADLSERLAGDGFSTLPISGDLPQAQRTRTLNAFRNGIVRTLIATDVAARGIDVADISTVIHFDLPEDNETYTHRSGRTGRAGQKGRSVLLVATSMQSRIERALRSAGIEATWANVPSEAKIHKLGIKRARKNMHDALASEVPVDPKELEYARDLLTEHDPATLVARLLKLTEPTLPREPVDVQPPTARPARREPAGLRSFVRFSINWGRHEGANPARLVAHICRRSGISSEFIGSLDISDRETQFDIDARQADRFAREAAKPDARDPHLLIEQVPGEQRAGSTRALRRAEAGPARSARPPVRGDRPGHGGGHGRFAAARESRSFRPGGSDPS